MIEIKQTFWREDPLEVKPAITLNMEHLNQNFLRKLVFENLCEGLHHCLLVPVLWNLVVSKLNILVGICESRIPGSTHTAA